MSALLTSSGSPPTSQTLHRKKHRKKQIVTVTGTEYEACLYVESEWTPQHSAISSELSTLLSTYGLECTLIFLEDFLDSTIRPFMADWIGETLLHRAARGGVV